MKASALAICIIAALALPLGGKLHVSQVEAAQPSAPTCQNVQLLIQPQSSNGAAGHIYVTYRIHNLSGQACTLFGYPGVQLLDQHFVSLPTRSHRGGLVGSIPRSLVRLGAHGNAYFTLAFGDVPINNQPCETAYYLMIFAPNNFLPVVTYVFTGRGHIIACSGNVDISPVTARPRF